MKSIQHLQKLLDDFVFRDSRLADHPKVSASISWVDGEDLVLLARSPQSVTQEASTFQRLLPRQSLARWVFKKQELAIVRDVDDTPPPFLRKATPSYRSIIAAPLLNRGEAVGVLSLAGVEPNYFTEKHISSVQLLAALLVYSGMDLGSNHVTPASAALGRALKRVREELGLTQAELAARMQESRIAVSRWESGAQPPTRGSLYRWCQELGLFAPARGASLVTLVDITPRLLQMLKENPDDLRQLSPAQFEKFIADRLDRMGFDVTLTGSTSYRDGGIDLIAVPKVRTVGAFLLAGQVKHHQGKQKTGRESVDRLLAWKDSPFRLGLLATNTEFTKDARWVATQASNQPFLRLRDFEDLKRWLDENFYSIENWQEIPEEINLAPGVTIAIPKPRVINSIDIWPISKLDLRNIKVEE